MIDKFTFIRAHENFLAVIILWSEYYFPAEYEAHKYAGYFTIKISFFTELFYRKKIRAFIKRLQDLEYIVFRIADEINIKSKLLSCPL